jgi:hypothetical protein
MAFLDGCGPIPLKHGPATAVCTARSQMMVSFNAVKARLRADVSAKVIGLDWQRHTDCGLNEMSDPPVCLTAKPALIPLRNKIIFMVSDRREGVPSSELMTATVNFSQASGVAACGDKVPMLAPTYSSQRRSRAPTRPPTHSSPHERSPPACSKGCPIRAPL